MLELLRQPRQFNQAHDITGILIYRNGAFPRVLEGHPNTIARLHYRIKRDPPHHRCLLLLRGLTRRFLRRYRVHRRLHRLLLTLPRSLPRRPRIPPPFLLLQTTGALRRTPRLNSFAIPYEIKPMLSRRSFLASASLPLHALAAPLRNKVKITAVKCMIIRGTWDWNLIRVDTDQGISGLGEAYWGPGVKDMVLNQFQPLLLGEDPLNVDKLYHKMLLRSGGVGPIGGVTVTAASGIEIALWDLAGKLLDTPAVNLLGGKFRDRVRFYRTLQTFLPVDDRAAYRDGLAKAKAEPFGWTAFKVQGDGIPRMVDPEFKETGHDEYTRGLTLKDLRRIAQGMQWVRAELGPDTDFGIEAHWKYDTRDAINMARAIEPVQPMWLEDPVPPENPEAMRRVTESVNIPICTGENLYGRHGFRKLIELEACDAVHIDIPKSGGLLESKRISDHADIHYIWTAAHNPASPIGTIASCHAAASMRNFRIHELAKYIDWWQDLVLHDGPIIKDGYHTITTKPGYGISLNPDVARRHLAPGETWWG